ncbi:MAG: hypothetical protein WDW38_002562 [Sanguina aurantia]
MIAAAVAVWLWTEAAQMAYDLWGTPVSGARHVFPDMQGSGVGIRVAWALVNLSVCLQVTPPSEHGLEHGLGVRGVVVARDATPRTIPAYILRALRSSGHRQSRALLLLDDHDRKNGTAVGAVQTVSGAAARSV